MRGLKCRWQMVRSGWPRGRTVGQQMEGRQFQSWFTMNWAEYVSLVSEVAERQHGWFTRAMLRHLCTLPPLPPTDPSPGVPLVGRYGPHHPSPDGGGGGAPITSPPRTPLFFRPRACEIRRCSALCAPQVQSGQAFTPRRFYGWMTHSVYVGLVCYYIPTRMFPDVCPGTGTEGLGDWATGGGAEVRARNRLPFPRTTATGALWRQGTKARTTIFTPKKQ